MKKRTKIQIALLAVLLIILIVIKHSIPKPLNWDKTYEYVDKIPYGCSGLYSVLKDLFPTGKISVNRFSYYRYFRDKSLPNNSTIIITDKFSPDTTDRKALLDQVALGNNLFIAASDIDNKMCHLLGIKLQTTGFDLNPFTKDEKKVVFTDKE